MQGFKCDAVLEVKVIILFTLIKSDSGVCHKTNEGRTIDTVGFLLEDKKCFMNVVTKEKKDFAVRE